MPRLKLAVTGSSKYPPINYQSKAGSYTALLLYRYYSTSTFSWQLRKANNFSVRFGPTYRSA